MIETYTQIPGHDSLKILCLITVNIQRAVTTVIDRFPSILARFGASALKNDFTLVSLCEI